MGAATFDLVSNHVSMHRVMRLFSRDSRDLCDWPSASIFYLDFLYTQIKLIYNDRIRTDNDKKFHLHKFFPGLYYITYWIYWCINFVNTMSTSWRYHCRQNFHLCFTPYQTYIQVTTTIPISPFWRWQILSFTILYNDKGHLN